MTGPQQFSSYQPITGRWLRAGQAAWVLVFGLSLVLWVVGAYAWYDIQSRPCSDPAYSNWAGCEQYFQALAELPISPKMYGAYLGLGYWLAGLPFFVISFILARRRVDSANVLFFAMLMAVLGCSGKWSNPLPDWAAWLVSLQNIPVDLSWAAKFTGFFLAAGYVILCAFPDGVFVPRWTRWLMVLVWLPLTFLSVFFPDTWLNYWNLPTPWSYLISLGFLAIALWSVLHRYRRVADATQRQQIKWFLLGVALIFVNYLIDFFVWQVSPLLLGHDLITYGRPAVLWELLQGTIWSVSEFLLAVCIAFSIFRYRLFDIDLIIRRTVLWAIISGLGLTVYLLAVGATSIILGSQPDYVIPLVALVLVALMARPLYQGLEQGLDKVWPLQTSARLDELEKQ